MLKCKGRENQCLKVKSGRNFSCLGSAGLYLHAGLQLRGQDTCIQEAVCAIQSNNLQVNLIPKHPYSNNQQNVWLSLWHSSGCVNEPLWKNQPKSSAGPPCRRAHPDGNEGHTVLAASLVPCSILALINSYVGIPQLVEWYSVAFHRWGQPSLGTSNMAQLLKGRAGYET